MLSFEPDIIRPFLNMNNLNSAPKSVPHPEIVSMNYSALSSAYSNHIQPNYFMIKSLSAFIIVIPGNLDAVIKGVG